MQELALAHGGNPSRHRILGYDGDRACRDRGTLRIRTPDASACRYPVAELKLVPTETPRYEIRIRGPLVTPGYFKAPVLTQQAFDDEGYLLPR